MEELPNYFDVIIVGTGMPECIIAAAAARIGKKVLHLDRNGYYGGDWASFSYDKFLEWMDDVKASLEPDCGPIQMLQYAPFLEPNERISLCPNKSKTIRNLVLKSYIKDSPDLPVPATANDSENDNGDQSTENNTTEEEGSALPLSSEIVGEAAEQVEDNSNTDSENQEIDTNSNPQPIPVHQEWTTSAFMENRRKFNIDLAPKIMFSRGSLVELLITSNIARYAEFQCITRILVYTNGHIEQVPCSRADVFSTENVNLVEKRMLMKFMNFCSKFEEQSADFVGYEDKPFVEFLKSQKLTSNIQHYIIHAIAMVDESCSTLQGLKATQKFLLSLGRYGNSPFLCTCYGSAELPQCFCRLCAVYEGMYYLKRQVDGIFTDQENKCTGIVSRGQRIGCEWLVMESTYSPVNYYTLSNPQRISRAILISDASVYPSEKRENILLRLPPTSGMKSAVTVLEFNSKNYVCPEDLYVVYMCCRSSNATASEDLKEAVELLFTTENTDSVDDKQNQKPKLLWSVYFNQLDTSTINLDEDCPTGVFLTSNPDLDLDYEHAVKQAHEIFEAMYPGEEFLPRAPDPEDILIEMHNNPGDEGECGKIENDVSSMDGDGENNTADGDGENNTADKDGENNTADKDGENNTANKDGENNTADEDGDQNAQESSEAIANDEN